MSEAQGSNIAGLQSQREHQASAGEKSGFGLGYSDSPSTIVDGMKWFFNFHEGAIASYNNIFEGLVSGSSLATLFGKSGNMFGIKILNDIAEHFSGDEGGGGEMSDNEAAAHYEDYPHANDQMEHSADGLHDAHDSGDHHGQSFDPGPSPSVGNNQGHSIDD
ncbi:hypothetical protein [Wolbachia endosymbiont of Chironomus riparius]|uniref:hypothetical protein n=1 Tax=Wolbachia endosymbiont of Chironomus riparius TaxID=2883238 RepID=UPI00351734B2